ncbi:MAG: hypothetical protein ACI9MC_003855 [Kiritimatiellia bacterium]
MRNLALVLIVAACTPPSMRTLHAPPQELSTPIDPSCEEHLSDQEPASDDTVDCKDQTRRGMTRRAQAGVFTDFNESNSTVRLIFTGDTGVRDEHDPTQIGAGPACVIEHAKRACGEACDGVVLLGDNLYTNGLNDTVDSQFLTNYTAKWADTGAVFYVPGNHDWGFLPVVVPAQLKRAQRQLGELRRMHASGTDVRGDSHFWSTTIGDGRLVGLDSNYLVRGCDVRGSGDKQRLRCAGDPRKEDDKRVSYSTMLTGLTAPGGGPTVVVGHHPWLSHGEHGHAGDYWDRTILGVPMALDKGAGFRWALDTIVGPNSAIYLSGHDHNTQVARVDDNTLSVVVGAGGKVTGPGPHTGENGSKRIDGFELEHYCDLGYAMLDVSQQAITLRVHTLPAPGGTDALEDHRARCEAHWRKIRPDAELPTSPSCTQWTWTQRDGTVGTWSASSECPVIPAPTCGAPHPK